MEMKFVIFLLVVEAVVVLGKPASEDEGTNNEIKKLIPSPFQKILKTFWVSATKLKPTCSLKLINILLSMSICQLIVTLRTVPPNTKVFLHGL